MDAPWEMFIFSYIIPTTPLTPPAPNFFSVLIPRSEHPPFSVTQPQRMLCHNILLVGYILSKSQIPHQISGEMAELVMAPG
jgi:hypothetical protein